MCLLEGYHPPSGPHHEKPMTHSFDVLHGLTHGDQACVGEQTEHRLLSMPPLSEMKDALLLVLF